MCEQGESATVDRYETMLQASSMYYLQDLKMDVIARHLGTSRSTVSRLIKQAREEGLVEITLRPDLSRAPELAEALQRDFGVRGHVVPVSDRATPAERLEEVATTAGELISGWFTSGMTLGVAWGTTTAAVAAHLPRTPTHGSAIVQLNGAANTRTGGLEYASQIIGAFGRAFTAPVHYFTVPAFFDYAETRELMWRERSVQRVIAMQHGADIALFGVGSMEGATPSHVYSAGYLDEDDFRTLRREGVVGDVCTVLLRGDGSYDDIPLNARASGPTPAELRRIPRRVCVVADETRAVALLAVLRSGAVTDLVVDEVTANQLFTVAGQADGSAMSAASA